MDRDLSRTLLYMKDGVFSRKYLNEKQFAERRMCHRVLITPLLEISVYRYIEDCSHFIESNAICWPLLTASIQDWIFPYFHDSLY